ncbi:TPA: hypothetical protein ACRX9Q_000544 [Klebsiella variicola]|uniref:hypothetical protein n=1 Tax=Klebsiella quasipneumoniae TaxID=1463165 RepID=UPI002480360C|nr:hypothetical protein [Klebsiella quasipneumoniae]MDH8255796.1 hypothetical protein [Klebsiella quasipneumoniae]
MQADNCLPTNDVKQSLIERSMLTCGSFLGALKMKMMIAAAAMLISTSSLANYKPFNVGQPMTFECETGVVVQVVDDKNVVINGDFEAKINSLTDDRLQASGVHGDAKLTTVIDLRFMGRGYFSLLASELDTRGSTGPWDDKFLSATAVICKRTK